jgi:hypothetical protein
LASLAGGGGGDVSGTWLAHPVTSNAPAAAKWRRESPVDVIVCLLD